MDPERVTSDFLFNRNPADIIKARREIQGNGKLYPVKIERRGFNGGIDVNIPAWGIYLPVAAGNYLFFPRGKTPDGATAPPAAEVPSEMAPTVTYSVPFQ